MGIITIVPVASLAIGANMTVNASWNISLGFHEILVNVSFGGTELNKTNNNATNNLTILYPRVTAPENNSWFMAPENNLTIIVNDYKNSSLNYTIYLDGSVNSSYTTTDGFYNNYISNLSEGKHDIIIEGVGPRVDAQGAEQSLYRRKNSSIFRINIDLTNATVNFETSNSSWFTDTTPEIRFNITDNLANVLNYSIYQNGTYYASNTTTNGTSTAANLSLPTEGPWDILVEATDLAGNKRNSSMLRVYIDFTPPSPNITTANNTNTSDNTPEIFFNITDNLASSATFLFYIDFITNSTTGTVQTGTLSSANLTLLSDGYHNITLEAADLAGNRANSSSYFWEKSFRNRCFFI